MSDFADRVVLITGAGSGLGRQLARRLSSEGAAIAALDLSQESLAALAAEFAGKKIATAQGDVTHRDSLNAAIRDLESRLGPADLLIANAGIGRETHANPYDAAAFDAQILVNLIGVSNSIAAVLPGMIARKRGHLVAISSLASYRGLPRMAGYCASKSGVNALMEALRVELAPVGLTLTTICPGWIRTPLTENIDVPKPYLMDVDYAAGQIVEAIRRRKSFFAFPRSSLRRVRLLRWLPDRWSDWLVGRLTAIYAQQVEKSASSTS